MQTRHSLRYIQARMQDSHGRLILASLPTSESRYVSEFVFDGIANRFTLLSGNEATSPSIAQGIQALPSTEYTIAPSAE